MKLCNKLDMSSKEVEELVSKRGEYVAGEFILGVENDVSRDDRKLPLVSLWKDGSCCYKATVNPYLYESLDIES